MHAWQMQDLKARLSEVVKRSESEGPQEITLHGQSVAVVISRAMFDQLSGNNQTIVEFMRNSPFYDFDETDLKRDSSLTREVSVCAIF